MGLKRGRGKFPPNLPPEIKVTPIADQETLSGMLACGLTCAGIRPRTILFRC